MSRTFSSQQTWSWRTLAKVVSQLFIRSSERAERIYAAMCARGWQWCSHHLSNASTTPPLAPS